MIILFLDKILIPEDAPNPFSLDLTLPVGNVSGIFYNKHTGLPINAFCIPRTVWILNEDGRTERGRFLGFEGNRFEIEGIKDGTYQVICKFPGFLTFRSKHFSIDKGELIELGNLMLDPTGIIELEVMNPEGDLLIPDVLYNGNLLGKTSDEYLRLPNGKHLFWHLPKGKIALTINAYSYHSKEVVLYLELGKVLTVQITLLPE